MVRWLTRFVGVFWTIAVALPSASAAEPLSGAMLVPPAGTIAHYTSTQVRFRAKEGLWVPLEVQASDQLFTGTPTGAAFGWLFEVAALPRVLKRHPRNPLYLIFRVLHGVERRVAIVGPAAWLRVIDATG